MIAKKLQQIFKASGSYNPYTIAKSYNINIIELPLDKANTYGLTVCNNRKTTIILNDNMDNNLKEFVLCHELGHVFLHGNISTPFMRNIGSPTQVIKIEAEAHRFAFLLLKHQHDELKYMTKENIVKYFKLESWMTRFI